MVACGEHGAPLFVPSTALLSARYSACSKIESRRMTERQSNEGSTSSVEALPDDLLPLLRSQLGDRVSTSPSVREHHSRGESYHQAAAPDLVVYPRTTEEISAIVRACAER